MCLELLAGDRKTIFLDGAMGTQLGEAGLEMGGQNGDVTHPDAVLAVHGEYADCGIDLLIHEHPDHESRQHRDSHKVGVDVREVNLAGARLAKAGRFVRASTCLATWVPPGRCSSPMGNSRRTTPMKPSGEQAAILGRRRRQTRIIETIIDLREALCAIRAAKEASDLPVIASIAFNTAGNGGRTVMGNTARDCAQALTEAWSVCRRHRTSGSLDPFELAEVVAMMKEATSLPIVAQPNAGRAEAGRQASPSSTCPPASFAAGVPECVRAGARLVGGCCGTSPAHIRAMVESLTQTRTG